MDHTIPYVISALRYHFMMLHDIRMHRDTSCEKWADAHGISRRKVWSIIDDLRSAGAQIVYDRCLMRYRIANDFDEQMLKLYLIRTIDNVLWNLPA